MYLEKYFPTWEELTPEEQEQLRTSATLQHAKAGDVVHRGGVDCVGLMIVISGQLRVYITSDEGREVTLYRLFERDMCIFSASCIMTGIQFEVTVEAERDTDLLVIPSEQYLDLMSKSAVVANYTNQLMASSFSEVVWLMDQILFKRFDTRLASFLLSESSIEGGDTMTITHEKIANHMGTAREVVTRMLKYFQREGMVALSRGEITITDRKRLKALAY